MLKHLQMFKTLMLYTKSFETHPKTSSHAFGKEAGTAFKPLEDIHFVLNFKDPLGNV